MEVAMRTEVTGDIPMEAVMHRGPLRVLPYVQARLLWEGCIDAPEFIVAGGVRQSVVESEFIGLVARAVLRG